MKHWIIVITLSSLFFSCSYWFDYHNNPPDPVIRSTVDNISITCEGTGYGTYNQLLKKYYVIGTLSNTLTDSNYFCFISNVTDASFCDNINTVTITYSFPEKYVSNVSYDLSICEKQKELNDRINGAIIEPGYNISNYTKAIKSFSVYADNELIYDNFSLNNSISINKNISSIKLVFEINKYGKIIYKSESNLLEKCFYNFHFYVNKISF